MCIRDRCIVGHQGNEVVTVDQISRTAKTINNETLTSISSRVPRLKAVSYTHLDVYKRQLYDLKSTNVMFRLVQGDVGCGKTIVAQISMYANQLAGYQSALLARTEILARQHVDNMLSLIHI